MTNQDEEPAGDRLLAVAGRLFSEMGYDAVSTDMIAEAADVDLATVVNRHGGRRGVYLAVMENFQAQRLAYTEAAITAFTSDADGLIRLFEAYLDYTLEHPQMAALWMHRWLSDASDIPEADRHFGGQLIDRMIIRTGEVLGDHLDAGMVTRMLLSTIHSFVRGGYVDTDGVRHKADDPAARRRFRRHLRGTIRQLAV